MTQEQVIALLAQLQQQHPQAFKFNPLMYSFIKTKGILDEIKEFIPWILAIMIFVSSSLALSDYLSVFWQHLSYFQTQGFAILIIMLVMRLYMPLVLWQIKYSSESLYQHLKNSPLKLTIVILLQGLNLLYIESSVFQYILFFFALSFGFVRLYKESMFLETTTNQQKYLLQQIRRATFWAYRKSRKKYAQNQEKDYFMNLYKTLKNYENKLCATYKHQDIESYIDDIK